MADNEEVKDSSKEPTLTEQDVWDVLVFARSMAGMYGNVYLNPSLVSGRMQDITLNPLQATQTMLDSAMLNPKENEKNLQEFSQSFELTSMVYKRLLSYLGNMLSFDVTYTSTAEKEDINTPKYKKDMVAVEKFLDKFEYKKEFRVAVREMLRNDAYFACFRTDVGDKYVLQELPSEYCKITGRWQGGFLFSFDMYWFLRPGVDINMYPAFFKKKYKEIWVDASTKNYDPSLPPELRAKSSWVYWVDVPVTVGVCFKLTPELSTRLPYFSPIFNDLILQPTMRNLQKNMNMAAASKMIMGEVPLLNKEVKSTVRDTIAISPDLLGKFMALVKSAISESVKVASAPLQNIRGIEFETEKDMYDSYLRTTLASTGINTNLIFTSNVKPNAIETQLSLNVDEQFMYAVYDQFNDFMDYWANKFTKTYKFNFIFEGTDFYLNREKRFKNAMELFDKGIVMPQKIAAALGMKPASLRKHMEEAAGTGFMDMLTPPTFLQQKEMTELNIKAQADAADKAAKIQKETAKETAKVNQKVTTTDKITTGPDGKSITKTTSTPTNAPKPEEGKGRPLKSDSEISEEGQATRDQGSNLGRGGKE